jgi:hypothetical protein
MSDQITHAAEAMRTTTEGHHQALQPALCRCQCGRIEMIASPVLGLCPVCNLPMTPLPSDPAAEGLEWGTHGMMWAA